MPPETQGEVVIDGHRTESTWYANTVRVARYGGDFNVIQDAIDYCNAIGGEWTIELYTGAYREGDITHTGVANITIKGMGLERAVIAPTVVPATAVIISGAILTLEGIEVIAPGTTRPALRVEGGTCTCLGQSEFLCVGAGNAIEQVAGQLILRQCRVPDDIDLSTAGCDLAIYHSDIRGDINASGALLAHTIWVESCYLHNHNINVTATGATTCTVANSTYLDQITNAGTGAFTINGTSVSRINQTNAAGTTTVYGGYVWQITRAVGSVVWWLNGSIIKVLPSGTITDGVIGHALTAAAAGNIVIRLVIGTYEEDNLVVPDNVQITGEGKNFQSQIIINSANPIITFGNVTAGIRRVGITQNGAASAIVINNAGADIYLSECQVSALAAQDAVNMTAGSANLHDCVIARGDIDLSTADCTLEMDRCNMLNGDIVTADAFNHAITLVGCDLNNGSITSLATGAVTIHISRSANIATIQDAGLLGTVILNFSEVETVDKDGTSTWTIIATSITTTVRNDNAVGGITIRGGSLAACGASVGSIVWYTPSDRHLFVLSGMKIAHALAVALAGDLIDIDEGTFAETGLALVDGVDLEGEGHTKTLITDNSGADICTAGNITTTLRKLRLDHSGGGVGACLALNNAGANVHLNQVEILGVATPTNAVEITAGTLEAHECYFNAGDIDLSADACTLTLVNCLIQAGDIDTAGDFNHTIIISYCNFTGRSLVNAATGATTLTVRFCSDILAISDAGLLGTSTVESCYVGTITKTGTSTWTITNTHIETALLNSNATGDITVYGGVIFAVTDSTGSIVWYSNEDRTLEVITGMRIAHALAEAGANSIIKIGPGTYAESNLQLTANVDLVGEDPEECQIVANSAAQPILKAVTNVTLSNLTVGNTNAGNAAIQVNPGNLIIVRNCVIYGTAGGECVDLQGGSIQAHETHFSVGVIHCDTQICTVTMDNCEVSVAFNTSAARAHVLTFMGCDFGGNNLASAATGATTLSMRGCSNVGTISNAGSGTFTILDSGVDTVTATSTGTFIITGGRVLACGGATASIIWKTHAQQYEVIAGMLIQHAITAAAADTPTPADTAPYTILIHPGVYDEGAIICSDWVNLKGIGPKGSVVIYRNDARHITLSDNVELQNLTLRLGTPTGGIVMVWGGVTAAHTRLSDIVFEINTPGAFAHRLMRFEDADTDAIIERCSCVIGGTGATRTIFSDNDAGKTIYLVDNDFTLNNANGVHIFCNRADTITGSRNRWAGTCAMFDVSGPGIALTFDHDAMICTGAWANTSTTMTLRHCAIEAPVVAGNLATVRLKNCSYRAIQRTGTGNIVDESPWLSDAPWKVEKWSWQAALANSQVAVRGGAVDGGSGQVLLPVTDGVAATQAAVEATVEVAGTLGTEFTPAKTPRFITQISVDDFTVAATNFKMFFGLRETLGNNVPVANEDHAGFEWDGAAWNAVSCLGANKSTTGLTTPTAGTHVQLEVIVIGGAQVYFYIDGILVHTETTNIPAAVLDWQHLNEALGNNSGDTVNVTVRNGGCQECPA